MRSPLLVAFALFLVAFPAAADVPADLSYRGQLLDAAGNPPVDPTIQVRIFASPANSTPLFIEDHPDVSVAADGRFEIAIGMGTPLLGSVGPELFSEAERYLELAVNGEVLIPRQPIRTTAFAIRSDEADQVAGVPVFEVVDGIGQVLGTLVGSFAAVENPKTSTVSPSALEVQTEMGLRFRVDPATGRVADRRELTYYFSSNCGSLPLLSVGDGGRIVEINDDPQAAGFLVAVPRLPVLSSVVPGSRSLAYQGGCAPYVGAPLDDLVQTTPLPAGLPFSFPLTPPVTTRPR